MCVDILIYVEDPFEVKYNSAYVQFKTRNMDMQTDKSLQYTSNNEALAVLFYAWTSTIVLGGGTIV